MTMRNKMILTFLIAVLLIGLPGAYALYVTTGHVERQSVREAGVIARDVNAILIGNSGGGTMLAAEVGRKLDELRRHYNRRITVVDLQKRIISSENPENSGAPYDLDKENEVGRTLQDGHHRSFQAGPEGAGEIVFPLSNAAGGRIGAVILDRLPLSSTILGNAGRIAALFPLLFAVVVGSSLSLVLFITRSLQRQLADLEQAVNRVAAGGLDVVVGQGSADEAGRLTVAFNRMIGALRRSRDADAQANRQLTAEIERLRQFGVALQERETTFRTLYENSTDGIFILDTGGNFIDMNRTAYERLGYTKEEMLSLHISQLNAPEFNRLLMERFGKLRIDGQAVFESAHQRKDGTIMPVEVNSRILDIGDRTVMLSVVRDLTERRLADSVIRKTNIQMRALIQAIPDMVIFKDTEGRHVMVNRTVEKVFNRRADEIVGRTVEELMPAEPAAACRKSDDEALRSGTPVCVEEQLQAADGPKVFVDMLKAPMVDESGAVIGLVAIGRDITTRKRAQDILRKSEEKYRELVESVNSIVLRWAADGRITFINSFGERFFGYGNGELTGQCVLGTIVPETGSAAQDLSVLTQEIDSLPERYRNNVYENIRKDGARVWVSWTNKPVVNKDGQLTEILSIGNDITERMAVQEELRLHREDLMKLVTERTQALSESYEQLRKEMADRERMEQELVKTQKLESLGLLAGGIAHDFNNLLTSILGNISVALFDVDTNHRAHEELSRAERATLRARDLTAQLLTFSKGSAPVKKTESVADLVRDTVEFALHGGRIKCDFDLPEGLWLADIDTGQMSQVVHNLIINADQAMPDGGRIAVSGENVRLPLPGGPSLPPGKYVHIAVTDNGIGIPAQHLEKIFDPYFTTKQRGSGLGLATSYAIIRKHGGSITVRSQPARGATFDIYLPASGKARETVRVGDDFFGAVPGRVLVMDDEQDVRETLCSMLERLGCSTAVAGDGLQAIERYREAQQSGYPFDVVIMDLTVADGMGGLDAFEGLREIDPDVRAIVSSGYSDDPVMANYADYGFAGVVSKPYRLADLGRAMYLALTGTHPKGVSDLSSE